MSWQLGLRAKHSDPDPDAYNVRLCLVFNEQNTMMNLYVRMGIHTLLQCRT